MFRTDLDRMQTQSPSNPRIVVPERLLGDGEETSSRLQSIGRLNCPRGGEGEAKGYLTEQCKLL